MTIVPENRDDCYVVLENGQEILTKVSGSKFLAQAFYAPDEAQLSLALTRTRRTHHDATHLCWAARHGPPDACDERADDDGEPAGTGGPPILAILQGVAVSDAAVSVLRWFGGTKLGKGGLARAYGDAARAAVAAAPRRTVWLDVPLEVEVPYDALGAVEAVLSMQARVIPRVTRDFGAVPRLSLWVRKSAVELVRNALIEGTAARARIVVAPSEPPPAPA